MKGQHHYSVSVNWTGNRGSGTSSYTAYDRAHEIAAGAKPSIAASSDPAFRGDALRYNPEELLVASLSSCHMLWYLHLCAQAGVIVTNYTDNAAGVMTETEDGGGQFTQVTLYPRVTVTSESMREQAMVLHKQAHALCFIARSVNFEVTHEPVVEVA